MMKRVWMIAAIALASFASTAQAKLVEFKFSGITSSGYNFPGTAISGSFSWDTLMPPTSAFDYDDNGSTDQAYYTLSTPFTMKTALGTFNSTSSFLNVIYNSSFPMTGERVNYYEITAYFAIPDANYLSLFNVQFYLPVASIGATLPSALTGANSAYADYQYWDADGGNSGSAPITISTSAVPEPASWALILGGFGLVGGTLRQRRRHAQAAIA